MQLPVSWDGGVASKAAWFICWYSDFWNKYYYYDYLPYKEGETDIFWTTNNERSRAYSVSRVHVTSSPCVSSSENIRHTGSYSALIYTSGHGGEYASTMVQFIPAGAFRR